MDESACRIPRWPHAVYATPASPGLPRLLFELKSLLTAPLLAVETALQREAPPDAALLQQAMEGLLAARERLLAMEELTREAPRP